MNNFFEKGKIWFLGIIILSVFLRFYLLGSNPPSIDWDEASLGYNAYSILKTGADEYGNKLPLSFRSFDDFKPPLYVYLAVPPVAIFGLNEFSVRLPSAILGVIAVITTYFLMLEILKDWKKKERESIALLSMVLMGVSPWHLQFSRAAFEGNIGLTFFLLGVLFLFKGIRNAKLLIAAVLFLAMSMYSYHSFRIITPLFILILASLFIKELKEKKKYSIIAGCLLILLIFPIFQNLISSASGTSSRLSMVSIFAPEQTINNSIVRLSRDNTYHDFIGKVFDNRRVVYFFATVKGYLDHWNPDFLFLHGDGGVQHHAVDVGMLYLFELPLVLLGVYKLLQNTNKNIASLFLLFLIAPLASSLTTGTPHPVRAIAMIPALHVFSAVGLYFLIARVLHIKEILAQGGILIVIVCGIFLNIVYYFHQYYVNTPIEYGYFWQYGYKEVFKEALRNENQINSIVITYQYDQPYIYYLFYNKIDPLWYQSYWNTVGKNNAERMKRVIGKYTFRNLDWSKDKHLSHMLFVGAPNEIPPHANGLIKEILFPDGKVAFRIVKL